MAGNNEDSLVVNGDTNPTSEFFDDTDFPPLKSPQTPSPVDADRLNTRIAELQLENSDFQTRIADLTAELEKLRVEKNAESERSKSNSNAAEAIAKRASELEAEVSRLQHDFITATNDASEANSEIQKLRGEIAELKREKAEVEGKVKVMEVKMEELVSKSEESSKLIGGFMQKIADRELEAETATAAAAATEDVIDDGDKYKVLKENLPVIGAVSIGVVILAGGVMCYVRHARN